MLIDEKVTAKNIRCNSLYLQYIFSYIFRYTSNLHVTYNLCNNILLPEKDQEGLMEAIWPSHQALSISKSKKERDRKINHKYFIVGLQKFT